MFYDNLNLYNLVSNSRQSKDDVDCLINDLERKINVLVAKRELEVYRATKKKYQNTKKFSRINNWVSSSAVRSAFARLTVLAFYDEEFVSVEKVTSELNISRPAAKTMLTYCLEMEWITQDERGGIQASPFSVEAFGSYVRKLSKKTHSDLKEFYSLSIAIKAIQDIVKSKENKK